MGWSTLGAQFCLELSFGVLLALAFVPRAPVGTLFYRVMGTAALVPLAIAVAAPLSTGAAGWGDARVWTAAVAALAYPLYSGPLRGARWGVALGWGLAWTAAALVLTLIGGAARLAGPLEILLASSTALATGAVAGSVGLAMVLGHWYLTVPNLSVAHLRRLNRVTVVSMLASIVLVALSIWVFERPLAEARTPLLGPWGLFHLGTRVAVGLVLPLAFAWMASSSLRFQNTRSATGILYASTVLVMIGAAASISLQDSYGVPL